MKSSRNARQAPSVASAASGPSSRRKHAIRSVEIPWSRAPSASAALSPPNTSSSGTPLAMCVCGSTKISARRTPAAAARLR
jgi:hypothetical protein